MKNIVTDHALLRWMERIRGMNLDMMRAEIALTCADALQAGATSLITPEGTFVFDGGKIVTVLEPGNRAGRARTMARRALREAAE